LFSLLQTFADVIAKTYPRKFKEFVISCSYWYIWNPTRHK